MGRKPRGCQPMTGAERQARHRARQADAPDVPARPPARNRTPPRPARWHAAVAALLTLQAEYAAWLEALPEATRETATGEALRAMVDLDLGDIMAIQPPLGFGRD